MCWIQIARDCQQKLMPLEANNTDQGFKVLFNCTQRG